jgi:hypothetical protein
MIPDQAQKGENTIIKTLRARNAGGGKREDLGETADLPWIVNLF